VAVSFIVGENKSTLGNPTIGRHSQTSYHMGKTFISLQFKINFLSIYCSLRFLFSYTNYMYLPVFT